MSVRYLVGSEAALAELLTRSDVILNKLTLLEESMASVEERAAAVVQFLQADRRALNLEIEVLEDQLEVALGNDELDQERIAQLQAERDAAFTERDTLAQALSTDEAEESALSDILAPIEAEMNPPAPEEPEAPIEEEPVVEPELPVEEEPVVDPELPVEEEPIV
jgi:chromosome segregation ATPase